VSTSSIFVALVVLFVLKFLFGIWLTRAGRPYNGVVLAVHKIISVLTAVLLGITVYLLGQDVGLGTPAVVGIIVTGLLFLLTIASGGLLSTDKPAHRAILIAHRVMPFLAVISTALTLYFLS
jgi:hypothetical protein